MGIVSINPGTGPVATATVENARKNVLAFIKDLSDRKGVRVQSFHRKSKSDYGEGRFCWVLKIRHGNLRRTNEIQMPGLPLERVRWLEENGKRDNIWDFPRLYVDDSSWIWDIALDICVPEKDE